MDIFEASKTGNIEQVKFLLETGIDVNKEDTDNYSKTALMFACGKGHFEIAKTLLMYGAKVNMRNDFNNTALIDASLYNRFKVVRLLLQHGADVNVRGSAGVTSLYYAIERNFHGITLLFNKYSHLLDEKNQRLLRNKPFRCQLSKTIY